MNLKVSLSKVLLPTKKADDQSSFYELDPLASPQHGDAVLVIQEDLTVESFIWTPADDVRHYLLVRVLVRDSIVRQLVYHSRIQQQHYGC